MSKNQISKFVAKVALLSIAFVGLQSLPATAADYAIDCSTGTITGATFTEQPAGSGQYIADVYMDGLTMYQKTVDVVNCEYGSARNAYGDDPKPGSGFLGGSGITYYVQVQPNTYGDVWGYNVWSGGAQAHKTYIIQFWNFRPGVSLSEDPVDGGTTQAVDGDADGTFDLSASPNSGFTFTSWSCNNDQSPTSTSSATTTITPSRDTTCTATFTEDAGGPAPEVSLTSSAETVSPGESVTFSTDASFVQLAAIFINGELPEYGYGPVGLLSTVNWESFPTCETSTFTVRIYETDVYEAPAFSDDYLASLDVTWVGDPGDLSCASSNPISSKKAKFKPDTPTVSDFVVKNGTGSLNVESSYSGIYTKKPTSYTVKVSPGGNSCVIYGASSSCEVIGLRTGVEYTVSVTATNKFGTSSATVLPSKYILTETGLLSFESKKTITGFAGDSAKLTKAFKAAIKKYINANTDLSAINCTGYTAGKPVMKGDKALAKARAKAVCAHIEKIKPSLITTVDGKTPALAWGSANRKVVIRGYSALG